MGQKKNTDMSMSNTEVKVVEAPSEESPAEETKTEKKATKLTPKKKLRS